MAHLLANGLHENKQTMHLGFRQKIPVIENYLMVTNYNPFYPYQLCFVFSTLRKKKKKKKKR
jgi:hypothetical protein